MGIRPGLRTVGTAAVAALAAVVAVPSAHALSLEAPDRRAAGGAPSTIRQPGVHALSFGSRGSAASPVAPSGVDSFGVFSSATWWRDVTVRGSRSRDELPISGYDGSNPFDCRIQRVGRATDFPRPEADPFCVEYDKTHQTGTDLGIVRFLLREPARVAAAVDTCFYYQRDHWHASIVPGVESTELYNWDGAYYFDKARGAFGVYVENVTVANSSVDPSALPGFPEELDPYFSYGKGGIHVTGDIPVVPRCVEMAQEQSPSNGAPGGV